MAFDIDDLRAQRRRKRQLSILLTYQQPNHGETKPFEHTCATEDISEGGLKIVSQTPLPLGVSLPLEVKVIKPEQLFKFLGEVKWCLEVDDSPTFFIGIKLLDIIENEYRNWLELVNSFK
ncbi:PilZ domain-containing protein [Aliikangiella maris]|uniref:PilZ domain-containing protein n=2 Tax=Aliikangiella maris TaxID=3162458 RepID=A0ABV2BP56_9GAMM